MRLATYTSRLSMVSPPQGDTRHMLYARFGRLRKDLETGSYSTYLATIEANLKDPAVTSDPALRIRGLAIKATINMNLNTSAARADWEEIEAHAGRITPPGSWPLRSQLDE